MTLFALLPAAGHSTRMRRPKLSLPLGDRTVLEWVIATLKAADINRILVVIGPHVAELNELAINAGAAALQLNSPTADMRTTIERGLDWIDVNWHPTVDDAFLLVPADHPVLDVQVVRQLVQMQTMTPTSILIPTFNGRRGHPTLIGWRHVAGIRALPGDVGLNAYLRAHPEDVREVPVASASILFDMDTPEDYERITLFSASRSRQ